MSGEKGWSMGTTQASVVSAAVGLEGGAALVDFEAVGEQLLDEDAGGGEVALVTPVAGDDVGEGRLRLEFADVVTAGLVAVVEKLFVILCGRIEYRHGRALHIADSIA